MHKSIFTSLATVIAAVLLITACGKRHGDTMVLVPVKDDPTVSFRIMFKVGSQFDPAGKEGLAYLTAQMITEGGTVNNSYDEVIEKLYPMAAGYSSSVDKEMTVINGRTHKDNIDAYYALFLDALLKPAFNEDDFDRIKSNTLNYVENTLRYSSDEELGKAALYNFIYKGTAYGHLDIGTVESLNGITLNDVIEFYHAFYTKDNFIIGLGGGYEDDLSDKLYTDLSTLPAGKKLADPELNIEPINGHEVLLVEKDADATAISFGFPIEVLRGDEDFYALALFNSWFGEHRNSSSHLYEVIREIRGMNYGDYSYIEIYPNGGRLQMPEPNHARRQQIFEVWIRPVQNQHRHFALRAAMRELKQVIESGISQEDFELTQQFLDTYALNYANTTMKRVGYDLDSRFYGIEGDYIEIFREKIQKLTLEQVNTAIAKHLQYDNIKIAMVTKGAEEFKAALVADTPSPMSYATPKTDEVLEEDKLIEVFPLEISGEAVSIIAIDKMFQK
jgi:zinc protease